MTASSLLLDEEDNALADLNDDRELRMLAGLSDPNLARVLGICEVDPNPWVIIEYTELGDLAHYLQYSEPLTANNAQRINGIGLNRIR